MDTETSSTSLSADTVVNVGGAVKSDAPGLIVVDALSRHSALLMLLVGWMVVGSVATDVEEKEEEAATVVVVVDVSKTEEGSWVVGSVVSVS